MNLQVKQNWVKALRSGEYKQGTGQLYNPQTDCYCILGVFFDVLGYTFSPDGLSLADPDSPLAEELGVPDSVVLFEMNDAGYDFNSLANYVEANVVGHI